MMSHDQFNAAIDLMEKASLGTGPDVPTTINEQGGRQSELNYRFDLIDGMAMFRIAGILHEGAKKYGEENWRNIPTMDHINKAVAHLYAYKLSTQNRLSDADKDDHLGHAFCRLMFACGVEAK